ncbi:MAG: hypothetical protein ACHP7H_05275, partial [Hyphomicrobiales bacterium]
MRWGLAVLCSATGVLALGAGAARAAPPETPETGKATAITATTATLNGVLNPLAPGLPGSYQFSYAPSETDECTPGALAPPSPALALGVEKEAVSAPVTELQPNREYALCLTAFSLSAEPASGAAVPFKTLPAKPKVDSETASSVTSTAATLEAQVNPNNQATSFVFEYATKATGEVLEGTIVKLAGASPLSGFGDQTATVPRVQALAPGTTYFYRVLAENEQSKKEGKSVNGTVKSLTTVATPHTEPVTAITATTATFNGTLTPLNATVTAEYSFDYNVGSEDCTGASTTTVASAGTGAGSKAVSTPVIELQPSASYSVCLVSSNAFGSEVDPAVPQVQFKTPAAAPTIEGGSEKVSAPTPFEATLEAQVNPENQQTTYSFQYSTTEAGGKLTGTITTLKGAPPLEGYGDQTASVATGHVLTAATTYHFRVIAKNVTGEIEGAGEFATPAATAPVIESEASSALTPEGATLEALINPSHQETTCQFEYGTEPLLTTHTSVPCPKALGSGGVGVAASVAITGLKLKTVYYFRVAATNATGATTDPTIEHFETEDTVAPTIVPESEATTEVTAASADLSARINPNGSETTYRMEYGTTTSYGASTPPAKAGAGRTPVAVSQPLSGLSANTTYHWRLLATNAAGTSSSPDETFVDLIAAQGEPCPNEQARVERGSSSLPDCRAYELVTPPRKNGALIGESFLATGAAHPVIAREGQRVIAPSIQ